MSRQSRHGEANFAALCQEPNAGADAAVNKASDDLHGWDHVIDIEPPKDARLPVDLQAHLIQCFAQIKTTSGKKPQTRLKLSNAIKAAKSALPSFVFLFHYANGHTDPKLFGRHIWESEIERCLKRARESDLNGDPKLHKQTVSFSFSESECLTANPIDWILDVLSRHGGENYAAKKLELVNSVGYGDFTHEGKFEIGPLESKNDIVLHELGMIEDLPVSEFRLFDVRFGIRSREPIDEFDAGRVRFAHEGKPLNLQISDRTGATFDIPAMAWTPRSVSFDHPEFRVRIKAGNIDIVAARGSTKQNFKINYSLAEQLPFLEQLGFLCLMNWSKKGEVAFRVQTEIGELFQGKIGGGLKVEPWMHQLETVGHYIVEILGRDRCSEVSISYQEFSDLNKAMHVVASIFTSGSFRFEAVFDDMIEPFEKLLGGVDGFEQDEGCREGDESSEVSRGLLAA